MATTFFKRVRNKLSKILSPDAKPVEPPPAEEPAQEAAPETAKPKRSKRRKKPKKRPAAPHPAQETTWDDTQFVVEPKEGEKRFHDLDLPTEIMHALHDLDFKYCTPIQADALPPTLKGSDATGRAQTGTGKTAAFLITILTHILRTSPPAKRRHGAPRALILAPTRELVLQIVSDAELLSKYCNITTVGVLGGIDYQKQQRQLTEQKVDMVVATPGRLLDFHRQKYIHLDNVEILVIDEADRMLDMGFIPDVRQIVRATPPKEKRQTLLFSATLTQDVIRLASQWTQDAITVEIEPEHVVTDTVNQLVYLVTSDEKFPLLYNLITKQNLERVIIFCNRRDETRFLTEKLRRYNINCAILSGDIAQNKRMKTLENFKNGKIRVLVATDVAGRGIHIEGISHVINYTLPYDPEDYVHRIGRTGRAGALGTSVSFADEKDSFQIPDIEEFIEDKLHCTHPDPALLESPPPPPKGAKKNKPSYRGGKSGKPSHRPRRRHKPKPQSRHGASHS